MKRTRETKLVLQRIEKLMDGGQHAALATVVRIHGSAYRREGAKLLIGADGSTVGNVSGGCLEQDVREVAMQVLRDGVAQLRSYCSGSDQIQAWDLGVGCDGEVQVYVERVEDSRDAELRLLMSAHSHAVCTLLRLNGSGGGRMIVTDEQIDGSLGSETLDWAVVAKARELLYGNSSALCEVEGASVFVDVFHPPPKLLIIGAGDDAIPLARLGIEVGFNVSVLDKRPAYLDEERFVPGTRLIHGSAATISSFGLLADDFVVLVNHNFADDQAYLSELVQSPARYIGLLGPRQRAERLLAGLGPAAAENENRIYGPVGLDIGGEGAEQVAVAVIGEMLSVHNGRRARSLRERLGPIHVEATS
jgi:xanthine dehydrogenase accessory factor